MDFYFHEEAEIELLQAIEYYEARENDLGLRFAEEVYSTIKRICAYPFAWEQIDSQTRRCLTDKFPYGILYRIFDDHIRIMAVMNLHRRPYYWRERK